VDGKRPTLEIISPLKNVKLRKEREDDQEMALLMMGPQNALVIGVIAGLAAFNIQQFAPHPLNLVTGWLAILLLFLALACQAWMIVSLIHKRMKRSSHIRWLKRRKVVMTASPSRDA
jgi:phage shock protein PspC (stress-responsive transcriptional regulator)